jgi:hypothetical protein
MVVAVFRGPLGRLIDQFARRGGSIGKSGITLEPQQKQQEQIEQKSENAKQALNWPELISEPIVKELSRALLDGLNQQTNDAGEREKLLLYTLARDRMDKSHLNVYRLIYGSQIRLLLQANARGNIERNVAKSIFDEAKSMFPLIHQNSDFDSWLNFLAIARFIQINEENISSNDTLIRDFLQFLVRERLTQDVPG